MVDKHCTSKRRPLWSMVNESACQKLAEACRVNIELHRAWVKWLERFSLVCSLATAAVAAGTATTTLLLPTSRFDEFRSGISSFLYVATGIVGAPKALKLPSKMALSNVAIGQYETLESRLYHEINLMVASDREDMSTFINSSYKNFKNIGRTAQIPRVFTSYFGVSLDEDNDPNESETSAQVATSIKSKKMHQELLNSPHAIWDMDLEAQSSSREEDPIH